MSEEFVLTFSPAVPDRVYGVEAVLRAQTLDPEMHPSGTAKVTLWQYPAQSPISLCGFQLLSLQAYVADQQSLKEVMARALRGDRSNWDTEKKYTQSSVWQHSQVITVEFDRHRILQQSDLEAARKHFPGIPSEPFFSHSDSVSTKSTFTVVVKCEWDDEHWRRLLIRDGTVVSFSIE